MSISSKISDFQSALPLARVDPNSFTRQDAYSRVQHSNGRTTVTLYGGHDRVNLHWNADGSATLTINGGDQMLTAEQADHLVIDGGRGNDHICVTGDAPANAYVKLIGNKGNDLIIGGSGSEDIESGDGNDCVFGGAGDDAIYTGSGDDHVYGGEGNDRLSGGRGDDVLCGEAGDDILRGGSDDDTLYGGSGVDSLTGHGGNNQLYDDVSAPHGTVPAPEPDSATSACCFPPPAHPDCPVQH